MSLLRFLQAGRPGEMQIAGMLRSGGGLMEIKLNFTIAPIRIAARRYSPDAHSAPRFDDSRLLMDALKSAMRAIALSDLKVRLSGEGESRGRH